MSDLTKTFELEEFEDFTAHRHAFINQARLLARGGGSDRTAAAIEEVKAAANIAIQLIKYDQ